MQQTEQNNREGKICTDEKAVSSKTNSKCILELNHKHKLNELGEGIPLSYGEGMSA